MKKQITASLLGALLVLIRPLAAAEAPAAAAPADQQCEVPACIPAGQACVDGASVGLGTAAVALVVAGVAIAIALSDDPHHHDGGHHHHHHHGHAH